jgi:hypothetical protein
LEVNSDQPYLPPQPPAFAYLPPSIAVEPAAVKVFGVLHLLFAAFGLLMGAWTLFITFVGNPFLKFIPKTGPMAQSMDAQLAMQAKIMPATLAQVILTFLVAVPMIIAGIYLLKGKTKSLRWSNYYAYSSLAAKLINLVLVVVIMIPAMQEMSEMMMPKSSGGGQAEMIMRASMGFGAVIGVVCTCLYPILSLVLLNRASVKDWLGRHGK